jgi:hypothetical protein
LHEKYGADGIVQNADKEHSENLTVQLTIKCSDNVTGLHKSTGPRNMYGSTLMRLLSVKPVFITFCRVRRWIGQRGVWSIHPDLLT